MNPPLSAEPPPRLAASALWDDLLAHRFANVQAALSDLLARQDAEGGAHALAVLVPPALQPINALWQALTVWQRQSPQADEPLLLSALVWDRIAVDARGSGWSSAVGEGAWSTVQAAQTALFVHAIALADRGPLCWPLLHQLMRSVAALGVPVWMSDWMHDGFHPADGAGPWRDMQALLDAWMADAPRLPDLPQQIPAAWAAAIPQPPEFDANGEVIDDGEDASGEVALAWLQMGLQAAGHGLPLLDTYARLRTPRWGGSHEEILALADGPLAESLDASQRNQLRMIAWLDAIDVDSIDTDDRGAVQQAFARGMALLAQPQSALERTGIHLQLAELAARVDNTEVAAAHYAAAADPSVPRGFDDHQLMRMLHAAAATGMGDWLAPVVARQWRTSAWAAVMHGVLLDTGWCGALRDTAQAEAAYRQAGVLMAVPQPGADCPFNDVYYTFDDAEQHGALLHMAHVGAELGFPEMQAALGYHYFEHAPAYDPALAIQWYSRAAAQDSGRALYNLSLIYDRGLEEGGIAGIDVGALVHLSNACELRCLELAATEAEWGERMQRRVRSCVAGVGYYLRTQVPAEGRLPRLLETLGFWAAHDWTRAAWMLAQYYASRSDSEFDRAVLWVERACAQQPEEDDVLALRATLQRGLFGSRRYRQALERVGDGVL